MIISYKIHLQFCNIRTDFHYPSPISTWKKKVRPVDASQDETLGFESNGGSNHAAFSLNHIRCGGFIGRSHRCRPCAPGNTFGAGRPKHTKLWETVDELFELLKLHPYSSLNYSNSADFTTATQNAFFIQSMGSFGRVKFAPFSYITLNLFICAKFVTSCRSLTTREQARSLYPRTPAHTRIVS